MVTFRSQYVSFLGTLLFVSPAFAQSVAAPPSPLVSRYVNSELPSWLRFDGEERTRFETLDGVSFGSSGNYYLLQRLRLNATVTPLPWMKFRFQGQDSRSFFTNVKPTPSSQKDPMDLRLGYIQIGTSETSPVSLRAGRQDFSFGEGRLLADPNWSNVGRSFDAVRATFRYKSLKLDAFAGASDRIYADGFATPVPAEHFDGLYGSIGKLVPGASIEPYLFWKMEHNISGELIKSGNLDEKTVGLRWIGKLPYGFDYGAEMALQRGSQAGEPISAWAGHWVSGYTFSESKHRPRLFAEFNRASGDQNRKDGTHSAFDPLFPSSHDKYGLADQFTWTNLVHARSGFQYRVTSSLTVGTAYNSFWLANREDGIYSGSKLMIASNGLQGNHIGQEGDLQGQWTIHRETVVDLGVGHIFPGEFLQKAGKSSYNCVFFGVGQRF